MLTTGNQLKLTISSVLRLPLLYFLLCYIISHQSWKHFRAGAVSLAGAEPNLWSVHGGNKQVPIALLNSSGAHFHSKQVDGIELTPDQKFALHIKDSDDIAIYDSVILATPLTQDTAPLQFVNFPVAFQFPGSFQSIYCTMVHGQVNYKTFQFDDESSAVDEIFTTNTSLFFNSLSRNYPVDLDDGAENLPSVWKVFSNARLNREQLDSLFSEIEEMHVVKWKAYPQYRGEPVPGNFTLYPGLYHINTIEWAASAIDMAIIGARNVALLTASQFGIDVRQRWQSQSHLEL